MAKNSFVVEVIFKLTKNVDPGKYSYSGSVFGFDACRNFLLSDGSSLGKNVITFGAEMISSVYIDNQMEDILILGKVPADGLDDTTLTSEKDYSTNFSEQQNLV